MLLKREFKQFHENIKAGDLSDLQSKREILENKIKENYIKELKENGIEGVSIDSIFDQGSFKTCTLIKPKDGIYDRDVALVLKLDTTQHKDSFKIKKILKDVLEIEKKRIPKIYGPCVTVHYHEEDEEIFHIDIPVYAVDDYGNYRLGRGKKTEDSTWEASNPKGISDHINNSYPQGKERDQFRKVIKYLKKWKAMAFENSTKNATPPSIALTLLVTELFNYKAENDNCYDLKALDHIVKGILGKFQDSFDLKSHQLKKSIEYFNEFEPYDNFFRKLTLNNQNIFYENLKKFSDNLDLALNSSNDAEAANYLSDFLGEEFPIPEAEDEIIKNSKVPLKEKNYA